MARTPYGELIGFGLLGLFLFMPSYLITVNSWLTPLFNAIPVSWKVFGTASMASFGAIIGLITGYIIYKT